MIRFFCCLALLVALVVPASADIQVFNTGVNSSGGLLTDGAVDPHYTLVGSTPAALTLADSTPAGFRSAFVINEAGTTVIGSAWVANTSVSRWIGPNAVEGDSPPRTTDPGFPGFCPSYATHTLDGCDYTYQTKFVVTLSDPSTARLMGLWSTDNAGVTILLNGNDTGNVIPFGPPNSFDHFTPFTITTGFRAGENTLEFVVDNAINGATGTNPSGLQVEFTEVSVPEPSSILLLGTMLLGVAGLLKKRLA